MTANKNTPNHLGLFLFVLLLSSCNLPASMMPASGSTMLLESGGYLRSPEGLELGAPANSLSTESMPIELATASNYEAPFPAFLEPVGNLYSIAVQDRVNTTIDKPLLLGLPIPPNEDPEGLLIAVQISLNEFLIEEDPQTDPQSQFVWQVVSGFYDEDHQRYLTTLGSIPASGYKLALVRELASTVSNFQVPGMPAAPFKTNPTGHSAQDAHSEHFTLLCVGFEATPSDCSGGSLTSILDALEETYALFVTGQGFQEPYIRRQIISGELGEEQVSAMVGPYEVQIHNPATLTADETVCNGSIRGYYGRFLQLIVLCGENANIVSNIARSKDLPHEFFHAIQFAYPGIEALFSRDTIEASAVVAEQAALGILRDNERSFHMIDVPLARQNVALGDPTSYQQQDFFVYLGLRSGLNFHDLMEPILEAGTQRGALDQALRSQAAAYGDPFFSLKVAFWDFLKDYTFEHQYPLPNHPSSIPLPGCAAHMGKYMPQLLTVEDPRRLEITEMIMQVPAMAGAMVQIDVRDASTGWTYGLEIDLGSSSSEFQHKIYPITRQTAGNFCDGAIENEAHFERTIVGDADPLEQIFILYGNTDFQDLVVATTELRTHSIEIISHLDGDQVAADELVELRADHYVVNYDEDPGFKVIWRLGGPEGELIGEENIIAYSFPAGEHFVYVEYGLASAWINLSSISTDLQPVIPTRTPIPEDLETITPDAEGPIEIVTTTLTPTFTAVPEPGGLLGSIIKDINGNGATDGADDGIAGVDVHLTRGSNCAVPGQEASTITNAQGLFAFTGLETGTYCVTIDYSTLPNIGGSWVAVNQDNYVFTVESGLTGTFVIFLQPVVT